MSNNVFSVVAVFVAIFLVIAGGAAVGGVVLDGAPPDTDAVADDHWQLDAVEPTTVDESSTVDMESNQPSNTVVIHLGGGTTGAGSAFPTLPVETGDDPTMADVGRLGSEQRSVTPLTTTLIEHGHEVQFYRGTRTGEPLSSVLAGADAFVTASPGDLSETDVTTVESFVDAGGRTLMLSDPGSAGALTDIGSAFGVYGEAGYVYDMEHNDASYLSVLVEPNDSSTLTQDIEQVVLRGAAPVGTADGGPSLTTAETSQLSTTRDSGSYGVAVQNGPLAVIGDSSFLAPENAAHADNGVLIGNVADFLVRGETPDVSFGPSAAPGGAVPPGGVVSPGERMPSPEPSGPPENETA